jgi:hypothetical protein
MLGNNRLDGPRLNVAAAAACRSLTFRLNSFNCLPHLYLLPPITSLSLSLRLVLPSTYCTTRSVSYLV